MADVSSATPDFGVFARDMLPERIAARLVSLIAERQLRSGDKLPPERELAAAMGVSRASLREALRALATVHIVEIRQGSGTYVTSLKPELVVEHLDFIFALDDDTFAELLEARRMLEPSIAAAAAERATEAELIELRACVADAAAHADDLDAFLQGDLAVHQLVTAAAHNEIIARFMASLNRLGTASRRRTGALPGVRRQSAQDHQALVEAIARRDPDAAAAIMRQHLEQIQTGLRERVAHEVSQATPQGEPNVADHNMG